MGTYCYHLQVGGERFYQSSQLIDTMKLLILAIVLCASVFADPKPDCDKKCPKIYLPVCGSDGKKYNNKCLMKLAACEQGKQIHRIIGCPKILKPVCGSDGKKYGNKCLLTAAACETGKEITVVLCASVFADPKPDCDKKCPKIYLPVCGSDGKKYNNKCLMKLAACEQGKQIHRIIGCPKILKPVCGSDGKKYGNKCLLTVAACETGKEITVVKCASAFADPKPDCDKKCPKILLPVCGSDGKKYNNRCLLTVAACKTGKEITVVKCTSVFPDLKPNCDKK